MAFTLYYYVVRKEYVHPTLYGALKDTFRTLVWQHKLDPKASPPRIFLCCKLTSRQR